MRQVEEPSAMLTGVVEIRSLSPDDWPIWRSLRMNALAEAPYAFCSRLADWQGEGDRAERWRERLGIPGSYNIVAVVADQPVGMASGVPTAEADTVELISMWVAPVARGRGVGDALLAAVERWARDIGARVLRLDVTENNPAAAALYRRNGLDYTGEQVDSADGQTPRQRVMAAKTLQPSAEAP